MNRIYGIVSDRSGNIRRLHRTISGVGTLSQQFDNSLSLPIILAWFRVNLTKIILGGIVCALLAVPIVMLKSKTYESSATLLVSPPTFKDRDGSSRSTGQPEGSIAELMPRTLPMEAYKTIALTAPLLREVKDRVEVESGVKSIKRALEVELVKMGGRGAGAAAYTQAIVFHAQAPTPELAAQIAQTWAEVFKERVDEVAAAGVNETYALLETLYENTKTELEETERALAEHRKTWNLELIEARLKAKQAQFTELESSLKQTEIEFASTTAQLAALEEEFAKEPQKYVYWRSPSNDAFWITQGKDGGDPTIEVPSQGLLDESPNANYTQIRDLVVRAKEKLEGLKATKESTLLKLDELEAEMEALSAEFYDKTVERDMLTRELNRLVESNKVVSGEYEMGRMANQTQASDIVIAGDAVPTDQPIGWGGAKIVLVAAFAGMILTSGLMLLKKLSEMVPLLGIEAEELGAFMIGSSATSAKRAPGKPDTDAK